MPRLTVGDPLHVVGCVQPVVGSGSRLDLHTFARWHASCLSAQFGYLVVAAESRLSLDVLHRGSRLMVYFTLGCEVGGVTSSLGNPGLADTLD